MLRTRVLTAVVLLGGFLGALFWLERWQFAILVGAVVALAAYEWAGLSALRGPARALYAAGAALIHAALALSIHAAAAFAWLFAIAAAFWLVAVPAWLWIGVRAGSKRWLPPIGLVVIVPAGAAMIVLSPVQLLAVLALTWIADTAAYFSGRAWGRRKLAPSISPGKTREGAFGALVAVAIYAIICANAVPELRPLAEGMAWIALVAGALLLALVSILGDLFESAIKRLAAVKDSGTLLPGHGGVLDRIDSATATLPLAALLFPLLFRWVLAP